MGAWQSRHVGEGDWSKEPDYYMAVVLDELIEAKAERDREESFSKYVGEWMRNGGREPKPAVQLQSSVSKEIIYLAVAGLVLLMN